jgi:hypothetical protein
VELIKVL